MYELTETQIVNLIIDYLVSIGWDRSTLKVAELHSHGADIDIRKGKTKGEHFIIECKKKYTCKSEKAVNSECWLNALGQLITRMDNSKTIKSGPHAGDPNRAVKYGLGLYWKSAKVALARIPSKVATALTLHIFSVNEDGFVKQFTPKDFGKKYSDESFFETDKT